MIAVRKHCKYLCQSRFLIDGVTEKYFGKNDKKRQLKKFEFCRFDKIQKKEKKA